jgi:hypothetical protein
MQTARHEECVRISNFIQKCITEASADDVVQVANTCAKRILDGNFDYIPFSWRRTQNEILLYTEECTISYDLITGELLKCKQSNFDLWLAPVNPVNLFPLDIAV